MSITPDPPEAEDSAVPKRVVPPLAVILGLLAGAVTLFSYLGAYAVSNMLLQAQFINHWPPGTDPRPKWMLALAAGLTLLLGALAVVVRASTGKTMAHLDRLEHQENPIEE